MIPEPSLLSRSGLFPRLMMQIAASALLTIFYTPGGAAGWVLELLLRFYFAFTRRPLVPVRVGVSDASRRVMRLSGFVEK